MDSLSQFALGSAVGIAVMGRRTKVWKAALWGGVCGTLPDLDSFIDHGDPVRNMTFHRAESHALFYLTLASVPLAWLISRVGREPELFKRWWLAVWLALITHPLLDLMTVYGTQLALPFSDYPFGVGSVFIIDPLYTLPLLIGAVAAVAMRGQGSALRWNAAGLVLSTAYLAWSVGAQQIATSAARDSLRAQGIEPRQLLVTPTAFNTVLWRIVARVPGGYYEGFYSLLDKDRNVAFDYFKSDDALYDKLRDQWAVARIAWFTHGLFAISEQDGVVRISDLRMGQEPNYAFTFAVAVRNSPTLSPINPEAIEMPVDVDAMLDWLWRRLRGDPLKPPRGGTASTTLDFN